MRKSTLAHELGAYHWAKLERLAGHFGHQCSEEYAATLLKRAIDESEMWMRADLYEKHERLIADLEEADRRAWEDWEAEYSQYDGDYDDGIPF